MSSLYKLLAEIGSILQDIIQLCISIKILIFNFYLMRTFLICPLNLINIGVILILSEEHY